GARPKQTSSDETGGAWHAEGQGSNPLSSTGFPDLSSVRVSASTTSLLREAVPAPCRRWRAVRPPRVAARPVPLARTRPVAGRPVLARAAGRAVFPRAGCGVFGGILKLTAGACAMPLPSIPAFPQAGGLGSSSVPGGRYWARTSDLPVVSRLLFR